MANEQTSVPLFVADTILTAAQQNISAGTGVPVFATTVTRDAAFGGANKALAEGQLCYLSATNVVQQYNGASWETVGPAAAGAFVLTGSANPSAVGSTSIDNCFSATYQNYLIALDLEWSSGGTLLMRMRVGGVDSTTSDSNTSYRYSSLTSVGASDVNTNAGSSIGLNTSAAARSIYGTMNIQRPFEAQPTTGQFFYSGEAATPDYYMNGGFTKTAATSFDGFTLTPGAGTITGKIRVYGLALS